MFNVISVLHSVMVKIFLFQHQSIGGPTKFTTVRQLSHLIVVQYYFSYAHSCGFSSSDVISFDWLLCKPQIWMRTRVRTFAHYCALLLPFTHTFVDYVNMSDRIRLSILSTIVYEYNLARSTEQTTSKEMRNKSWVHHQISSVFICWWWCFMQRAHTIPTNQKSTKNSSNAVIVTL